MPLKKTIIEFDNLLSVATYNPLCERCHEGHTESFQSVPYGSTTAEFPVYDLCENCTEELVLDNKNLKAILDLLFEIRDGNLTIIDAQDVIDDILKEMS